MDVSDLSHAFNFINLLGNKLMFKLLILKLLRTLYEAILTVGQYFPGLGTTRGMININFVYTDKNRNIL